MKIKQTTSIIAISAISFCHSSLAIASSANRHAAEAIKHAEAAKTHGESGHTKVLLENVQESLAHAKAAEKEHAEARQHMTESIKHLGGSHRACEAGSCRYSDQAYDRSVKAYARCSCQVNK